MRYLECDRRMQVKRGGVIREGCLHGGGRGGMAQCGEKRTRGWGALASADVHLYGT